MLDVRSTELSRDLRRHGLMQFDGFDLDVGSWEKCQKHGASIVEVESLFSGAVRIVPDSAHSGLEQRLRAVGRSVAGRWIFVAFTWRRREGRALIRPISARPMRDREVKVYEALSPLMSDEDAEDFVANADLTEYDPTTMVIVNFERTTGSGSVVLPDDLMAASLERAASLGMPLEAFLRSAIERALTAD